MCIQAVTHSAYASPCKEGDSPATSLLTNAGAQSPIVATWSMRLYEPSLTFSNHDHFFNSFGLFAPILGSPQYQGKALAEVLRNAEGHAILRQETMLTPASPTAKAMAAHLQSLNPSLVTDPANFDQALAVLQESGLETAIAEAQEATDAMVASTDVELGCGVRPQAAGCSVDYGFIAQADRNAAPASVFTGLALGFALGNVDPRWIAVNLVSPEDGLLSLDHYTLHMHMVRYLHSKYPRAHVALHAGELIPGLVPPGDLNFHIREAVEIAGAERIGHGVAIRSERAPAGLMRLMKKRGVSVEVALTSNEQILGVNARTSQFPVYRKAGVTVTLASDDPGVERTDMSEQYQLAFEWFDLSYADLKDLSYASIEEAFVSPAQRMVLMRELDKRFAAFESRF